MHVIMMPLRFALQCFQFRAELSKGHSFQCHRLRSEAISEFLGHIVHGQGIAALPSDAAPSMATAICAEVHDAVA